MKFEAADKKKGMTVQELIEVADTLKRLFEVTVQSTDEMTVKAWVNIGAGIKSLEV